MRLTIKIESCCTVCLTLTDILTDRTGITHYSRWVNVPTLTQLTQCGSILTITCIIRHLAKQNTQRKQQWTMPQNTTFCLLRRANVANQPTVPPNHVIMWMKLTATWKQTLPRLMRPSTPCDAKRTLQPIDNKNRTSHAMNRKRNGVRSILSNKLLWQRSQSRTPRQQSGWSREIQRQLNTRDWPVECLRRHYMRYWWLLEAVWAISNDQTMGMMEKMRMTQRLCGNSLAKITNSAGW